MNLLQENNVFPAIVLSVGSMTCPKCVGRVRRAIQGLDGVKTVVVDLESETAVVEGNVSVATLIDALNSAGYPASDKSEMCNELNGGDVRADVHVGRVTGNNDEDKKQQGFPEFQGEAHVAPSNMEASNVNNSCTATPESRLGTPGNAHHSTCFAPINMFSNCDVSSCHLFIEGMTCGKCVGRVDRALRSVNGVCDVQVHLDLNSAIVSGAASSEALIAALHDAGYPASIASDFAAATCATSTPAHVGLTILTVSGMTCGKCVSRVERALRAVPGVTSATVELDTGAASVDGAASAAALIAALEEAGYPAHVSGPAAAAAASGNVGCENEAGVTLTVEGMTCIKCVGRVERALRAVPGVESVAVSLETGVAAVRGAAPADALTAALAAAGYPAAVAGASGPAAAPPAVVHLSVEGMTCGKCVGRVERALRAVPGVTAAAADLERGAARAEGTAAAAALVAALLEAGYPSAEAAAGPATLSAAAAAASPRRTGAGDVPGEARKESFGVGGRRSMKLQVGYERAYTHAHTRTRTRTHARAHT
jgi:copper ion binding protein